MYDVYSFFWNKEGRKPDWKKVRNLETSLTFRLKSCSLYLPIDKENKRESLGKSLLKKIVLNNEYRNYKGNRIYLLLDDNNPGELEFLGNMLSDLNPDPDGLPGYSVSIKINFKLRSPYISRDDDVFYIIDNPIVKDKVFKIPMIRPTGWKGALRFSALKVFEEKFDKDNWKQLRALMIRLFGTENESLEMYLNKIIAEKHRFKEEDVKKMKKKCGEMLKEERWKKQLDKCLKKVKEKYLKQLHKQDMEELKEEFIKKLEDECGKKLHEECVKELKEEDVGRKFNAYLTEIRYITEKVGSRAGRLYFFPTFFNRISMDVITPLDRETKTPARGPIYFEIVPRGTEGWLRLLYYPFDLISEGKFVEIGDEIGDDMDFLGEAIKKMFYETGFSAKKTSGFGRVEYITERDIQVKGYNANNIKDILVNTLCGR